MPRSTPAWFCTSCCHFDGCFRFCCLPSVCSVASYIQYLIHWLLPPNTFYTHNLSKYGLFQSLPQYGLFQNPCLHTCFGLNLNRGLNKTNVMFFRPNPLLHKEPLYTKSCFTQRAVLHKELFYTKLCSPQITQCFTQKPCSCWACARAVCSLQGSSHFYGSFFSLKPPTKQSIIGYMEVY